MKIFSLILLLYCFILLPSLYGGDRFGYKENQKESRR